MPYPRMDVAESSASWTVPLVVGANVINTARFFNIWVVVPLSSMIVDSCDGKSVFDLAMCAR